MQSIMDLIRHLFVPHEDNNFRAKALHTDFLSIYLLFALVLTFAFKQFNLTNVLGLATDISVSKLYELTNGQRSQNGLPALSYNDKLAAAAALKAQDMFSRSYWAHYGPSGESPWDFIMKVGYQYEYAGENLAKNFLFSQGVIDGWMNSTTHRENILRKDYTEVGLAVVNGTLNGEPTTLVIQMFGKPLGSTTTSNQPFAPPAVKAEEKIPVVTVGPTTAPAARQPTPVIITKKSNTFSLPLLNFTWNINIIFLLFLLSALILDLYFASKMHIVRVSGKNVAHIIFVGFICLGLLLFTRGTIL